MLRNTIRYAFSMRSSNTRFPKVQFGAMKSGRASPESNGTEPTPSKRILEERNRTTEPQLTKGEIFSRANLAPQIYETSMEDNFQRTTVSLLGHEMLEANRNYIKSYSEIGFMLADETLLFGPIAIFPKTVLSWRVKKADDITPESVLLFTILEPKLDIVVIGVGDQKDIRSVKERLQPVFREHNIMLEVLDTPDACATFNFLNNEGRYVAAAVLPALDVEPKKDELRPPEFDKIYHGWFGMSEIPSKDIIDHTKKLLEKQADELKARGLFKGNVDSKEKEDKS